MTAVLFTACGLAAGCGGDPGPSTTAVGKPISPRLFPAKAWTGSEVFVFGGRTEVFDEGGLLNDGALLDPQSLVVTRVVSAPPFEQPLGGVTAAMSQPAQVFVMGSPCSLDTTAAEMMCAPPITQAAAVYDTDRDTWQSVDLPEEVRSARGATVVGTVDGGSVIVEAGAKPGEFWAFDGASDSWTSLGGPALDTSQPAAEGQWLGPMIDRCIAGDTIVAIESVEPLIPGSSEGPRGVRTHTYDVAAGSGWATEADAEITLDVTPTLRCTDRFAVLIPRLGPQVGLWQFDLETTRQWTTVPSASAQLGDLELTSSFLVQVAWEDSIVFVGEASHPSLLYAPGSGTLTLGPASPGTADLNPLPIDSGLVAEGADEPPGAGQLFIIPVK